VRLSAEFVERLCLDPWPGNVRELSAFAERLSAAGWSSLLIPELEACRHESPRERTPPPPEAAPARRSARAGETLRGRGEQVIAAALRGENLTTLARALSVSKDTLYRFLNRTEPEWRVARERARRENGLGAKGVER
jgi:DNA-binding NtrC family response regulator